MTEPKTHTAESLRAIMTKQRGSEIEYGRAWREQERARELERQQAEISTTWWNNHLKAVAERAKRRK